MKMWKIIGSIFGALAILLVVLFATPILGPKSPPPTQAAPPLAQVVDDGTKSFRLFLNQNIWAGDGTVTNDCDSLNFTITPNYAILRIHVEVMSSAPDSGDCPVLPEQFMYHVDFATPQTSTFSFELPGDATNVSPPAFNPGDLPSTVYITLHADVGYGFYTGTAYAASCDPLTVWDCYTWPCANCNWAYYFPYTVVPCAPI